MWGGPSNNPTYGEDPVQVRFQTTHSLQETVHADKLLLTVHVPLLQPICPPDIPAPHKQPASKAILGAMFPC